MNKKGPLSKVEKFYIENNYKNQNIDSICKDLDRAKSTVKRHISKCKDTENKNIENTFNAGSLFASHNGSVVMTQNASEFSDATKGSSKKVTRRQENCITSTNKIHE